MNDLVLRDAVGLGNLVGVASISLMAVVAVGAGASNEDGPVVGLVFGMLFSLSYPVVCLIFLNSSKAKSALK